jgi:hypothetical protein
MNIDFRAAAADATVKRLGNVSGANLAGMGDSGLVAVPGAGRRFQFWQAMVLNVLIFACMLVVLATFPLSWMGVISRGSAMLISLVMLAVLLLLRTPQARILRAYLTSRPDGLLRAFDSLPRRSIGLEETRTYKKTKFVTEDAGVCLLDAERRRLLIEGCQYRYVIHAKDVALVEPVSGYALSGARVVCRFAGQELDMVLTAAGQGPLASLMHAFAPSEGASSLAGVLNQTLFGIDSTHFRQSVPPPIPTSGI